MLLKIKNTLNMTSGMNYTWSNGGFLKQKKFPKVNSEELAKYQLLNTVDSWIYLILWRTNNVVLLDTCIHGYILAH